MESCGTFEIHIIHENRSPIPKETTRVITVSCGSVGDIGEGCDSGVCGRAGVIKACKKVTAAKVGALGPSGPFGRYGPVPEGGTAGGPLAGGERAGLGAAAAAAGEVEGYGLAGAGGGPPGIGASGNPRIREATIGAQCCVSVPVTQTHHIGRCGLAMLMSCAGCKKPILDKFCFKVLERIWHGECVKCSDCGMELQDKCYSRESKMFCRNDFYRRYGTKCSGCFQGISPQDLVRKARDKVFHLNCFTCLSCRKKLCTGEELYVLDDNKFICKKDFLSGKSLQQETHHSIGHHGADSLMGSGSEDEDDDGSGHHHLHHHHHHSGVGASHLGPHSLVAGGPVDQVIGHGGDLPLGSDSCKQEDSEDQGSLDGDPETRDSQTENKSPDGGAGGGSGDGGAGSKRRGPRTTIKAKQLEILKTAFSATPKPTRHIREQLAKETGLPMRVIQVWFQNKRSKERRLKQLTSMGRSPFFNGSRKMRGFPLNLNHGPLGGEDMPPAGFPYFPTDKFEFGYGAPVGFHHEFFGAHPPPHPHGPPFPGPGNPGGLDPASIAGMAAAAAAVAGEYPPQGAAGGPPEFLTGPPGQGGQPPTGGSPAEFLAPPGGGQGNPSGGGNGGGGPGGGSGGGSNGGGFPEPHQMQSEGLVW